MKRGSFTLQSWGEREIVEDRERSKRVCVFRIFMLKGEGGKIKEKNEKKRKKKGLLQKTCV